MNRTQWIFEYWEKNITDRITKGIGNVVEIVEDRLQNTISTGMNIIIIPRNEMMGQKTHRVIGRDFASVIVDSEWRKQVWAFATIEIVSDRESTFRKLNQTD